MKKLSLLLMAALFLTLSFAPTVTAEEPRDRVSNELSASDRKCGTNLLLEIKRNWSRLNPVERESREFAFKRPTDVDGGIDDQQHILPQLYTSPDGHFVLHWTNGNDGGLASDAPPLVDSDGDGVPDYVESFASIFDNVWATEIDDPTYGYQQPPSDEAEPDDGNDRNPDDNYDVFLFDMPVYGYANPEQYPDSPSYSYIAVENDYAGFSGTQLGNMQVTAAHEFFHAIQFHYDSAEESWWKEATAVWMEDEVYDSVNDYLQYIVTWLDSPEIPLTSTQGTHEYGSCIFAKFLSENEGPGIVKDIWEEMSSVDGLTAIENVLETDYASDLQAVFSDFVTANYQNGLHNHDNDLTNDIYEEGDLYDDVTLTADKTYWGLGMNLTGSDGNEVKLWAADYIRLKSHAPFNRDIEIKFGGNIPETFAPKTLLFKGSDSWDFGFPDDEILIVPVANQYDELIIVVPRTGGTSGDYWVRVNPKSMDADVVLDFDRSGSMGGSQIAAAKKGANTFIDLLEKPRGIPGIFAIDRDRVGLVSFSSSASLDLSLTTDFGAAKSKIDAYSASGMTNMGAALTQSINEISSHGRPMTKAIHSVVYLTDGQTNEGLSQQEILNQLVPEATDNDISIYTFGYGSNVDASFLEKVAARANGEYYFAPDAATLRRIYIEISQAMKGWDKTQQISGGVAAQETKTVGTISIPSGLSFAKVFLTWPGSDLDLILVDPDGNRVERGTTGVFHYVSDSPPEYCELYDPQPGTWTIQVYGKEVPAGSEPYDVFVFQPGALMQVKPTSWDINYPITRTTTFTVSESGGMVDLTGVTFTASDLTKIDMAAVRSEMARSAELEEQGELTSHLLFPEATSIEAEIPGSSFSFDPNHFSVPAGDAVAVTATLHLTSSVPAGDYSGVITVTNGAGLTTTIGVNATIPSGASIDLAEDWNLISFNREPADTSTPSVLAPIEGLYSVVMGYDQGGLSYYPNVPDEHNTLRDMDSYHGYWLKTTTTTTVPIMGTKVPVTTPLALDEGWNLVSYLPDSSMAVTTALASIEGEYKTVLGYDGGAQSHYASLRQPMNTLQALEPEHGYWIKMTQPGTLVYPAAEPLRSDAALANAPQSAAGVTPTNQWVNVYSLNTMAGGEPIPVGSTVSAYDPDGVKVGECVVEEPGSFGVLSLYGDDSLTEEDEGAEPGDTISFYINGQKAAVTGPDDPTWTGFGDLLNLDLESTSAADYYSYCPLILK